jgi:hypothetical protein
MNPKELSRREFLKLGALALTGLAFKDIKLLYSPVMPIYDSARIIKNEFGLELPTVDCPIFTRIIDEAHPLTAEFINKSVKPYLFNIIDIKFRVAPNAPLGSDKLLAHSLVKEDLTALVDGCWSIWRGMYIDSAYRDKWMQNLAYENSGRNHALIALPDASQHGNGLTFDFTSLEIDKAVDVNAKFEKTRVGQWLSQNSWNYGFVQSYGGNHHHDGKENESWHLTYIGRLLAHTYHALQLSGWKGDVFELQGYYPQKI